MQLIVNYLLESVLILGLLAGFYRLVLHRETSFRFNRFYLLMSLLMAAIVPLITITIRTAPAPAEGEVYIGVLLSTVTVYAEAAREKVVPLLVESSAFQWLYWVGCIGLLIRLGAGFIRLGGLSRRVTFTRFKGYKVADLPGQFNPFSFFNVVFVNQSRYSEEELQQIMVHELTHVRLKHSWDVLLLEVLLIVQWINPFAWWLRKLLKELHEFQADQTVLEKGYSAKDYKALLLFQATGARLLPVNNFNQSLTKKRFAMMKKYNLPKLSNLKSAMSLTVLALIIGLFACEVRETEKDVFEDQDLKEAVMKSTDVMDMVKGDVFFVVEDMPEYPGGEDSLRTYLGTSIKYPEIAKQNNQSGRVYITFVVDKGGEVKDAKVVRSSGFSILDEEALRVVGEMPRWEPGYQKGKAVNVSYTVPINFSLNGEKPANVTGEKKFKDMAEAEKAEIVNQFKQKGFAVTIDEENNRLDIKKL
jgi:TonB family protein